MNPINLTDGEKAVLEKLFRDHPIHQTKKHDCVIAMVGVCGSGKTTVARDLADKLSLHYISADDVRVMLRESDPKIGYERVRDILEAFVFNRLLYGEGCVIDSDFANYWKRLMLRAALAEGPESPLFFIRTTCDVDVMIGHSIYDKPEQFFADARTEWKGGKKGAVVKIREMTRQMHDHYEMGGRITLLPMAGIFATIDNSDCNLAIAQVDKVVSKIRLAEFSLEPDLAVE